MQHRKFCISLCIIENKSTWHSANCDEMDVVYRYNQQFGGSQYAISMVRELFGSKNNPRNSK
jgi:hypothetical protein